MKKLILFVCVIWLVSCQQNYFPKEEKMSISIVNSSDSDFVSKEQAYNVAVAYAKELFGVSSKNTRAELNELVDSVYAIDLYSDRPLMYVVNYRNGGFVIISAVRTHYPILAYSENTKFDKNLLSDTVSGLSVWVTEMSEKLISSLKDKRNDSNINDDIWEWYEQKNKVITQGTYEEEVAFRERLLELYKQYPGYSFGPLTNASYFLTESEYLALVQKASIYGNPQYAIFGYKSKPTKEVGPLIGTTWSQQNGFNEKCPNQYPAGCVAVAMAQIMKFHNFPVSYNWNNMPSSYATEDTQILIADIGHNVGMDYGSDGSSASIDDAEKGFKIMGYNVSKKRS